MNVRLTLVLRDVADLGPNGGRIVETADHLALRDLGLIEIGTPSRPPGIRSYSYARVTLAGIDVLNGYLSTTDAKGRKPCA